MMGWYQGATPSWIVTKKNAKTNDDGRRPPVCVPSSFHVASIKNIFEDASIPALFLLASFSSLSTIMWFSGCQAQAQQMTWIFWHYYQCFPVKAQKICIIPSCTQPDCSLKVRSWSLQHILDHPYDVPPPGILNEKGEDPWFKMTWRKEIWPEMKWHIAYLFIKPSFYSCATWMYGDLSTENILNCYIVINALSVLFTEKL